MSEQTKQIEVVKPFKYAYGGIRVVSYGVGVAEVGLDCAEAALAEGWAVEPEPGARKAKKAAPENKAKK